MKKKKGKDKTKLLVSKEKVRDLRPAQISGVAGGQAACNDTICPHTSCHLTEWD
jgi:hypothetical protein